jgi:putative ATPase
MEPTETIVNAANEYLAHGAGVAGAISSACGYEFDIESREYVRTHGEVAPGSAAVTSAGELREKYKCVVHAVGPIWRGGGKGEPDQLRGCIRESLRLAEEQTCTSISFPAISSGIFGYPKPRCAADFFRAIYAYIVESQDRPSRVQTIRLTNFDMETVGIFRQTFDAFVKWVESGEESNEAFCPAEAPPVERLESMRLAEEDSKSDADVPVLETAKSEPPEGTPVAAQPPELETSVSVVADPKPKP